jgi:hypothetical protein
MVHDYVGAMVDRYGVEEIESWVWVLFNEPGGVNAFSKEWMAGNGNTYSYYELFWNTSQVK